MAEDTPSGSYPIADDPLAEPPIADDPLAEPPPAPSKPVPPLPRMWKAQPEDDDEQAPSGPAKAKKEKAGPPAGKSRSSPAKSKASKIDAASKDGKRVLLEETPAFDTIESRQRVRLIVGASLGVSVLMLVWITYRAFLYDPTPTVVVDDPAAAQGSPEVRPSLDQEARFMYNRAYELAKKDQTTQAIEMLTRVVKVYKGTPTAADAAAALARPKSGLPLFHDGPSIVASRDEPAPAAPAPPPPAVVLATPEKSVAKQGEVALVLPVNPSEKTMPPPATSPAPNAPTVAMRPVPAGFKADVSHGVDESGWPKLIIGDRDGAPMVLVPGATVPMGGDSANDSPVISARVSTFYVDQHEVSNRQFRTFLHESHYKGQPPGKWLVDQARSEDENLPITRVSANDAKSFTDWAGKQLPTEAQWELAARSFDGRMHPWGNAPAKWSRPRVFRHIDPVMAYPEDLSPYGAFDMAGNAFEWTRDWYDPKYYRAMADHTLDNPTGPSTRPHSQQLVVKGCSRTYHLGARDGVPFDKRLPYLSFRCVLAVESTTPAVPGAPPGQPGAPAALPGKAAAPPVPF